ncbi:hypothetical protein JOF56_005408 [Kibdelosporangium banguiense]|uniref:Uncharacterized protein n=1 Tax=Kibdelosporangium banguiense TaxID=1365924 RepID=A0ABS4TKT1_9PSEU|nr:hypothetical protein [Kibdelosporangium banguiense]MBP2325023.1 hypothetical protein [Kibdelosporangium banguiense]
MDNLTAGQHERVRNLIRRSPAFIGRRVVVHEDRVQVLAPDELEIGLAPLLDAVTDAPPDQWPDLIDERLERIVSVLTGGAPELDGPTELLLDRIYVRLRPVEGSPVEWWTYAREIAPGLLVVFALDHPDLMSILNDAQVQRHGIDTLYDAGMDNLCGQLPDSYNVSDDGVYVLRGNDYTASLVLVMPWVVEATTGAPDFPYGVLVAMPNHGTLIFHIIRDAPGAQFAVGEIARLADAYYEEIPGGPALLTPAVHWWRPGAGFLEPIAHAGPQNDVIGEDTVTYYPADFTELLTELR